MAEVDTDVNLLPQNGFSTSLDDDLIDYDDEIVEAKDVGASVSAPSHFDEHGTVSDSNKASNVADQPGDSTENDADGGFGMNTSRVDQDLDDQDMVGNIHDNQDGTETTQTEGTATHENFDVDEATEATPTEPHSGADGIHDIDLAYNHHDGEQGDGIDYQDVDGFPQAQGNETGQQVGNLDDNDIDTQQDDATEATARDVTVQLDAERKEPEEVEEHHPDSSRDNDEITWEEGDDTTGECAVDPTQIEEDSNQSSINTNSAHMGDNRTGISGTATTEDGAASVSQALADANESNEYPAITVQYKGEEFPFFSTTSDGFFGDVAVIDDSIENLLAGFRAELIDEISSEDELVFQIDELGLEYAESSASESLSNVTLRQILEIFDLLVKNQDPDSSRTLYTYLFTKASTTRRFDSLVESAAAGKGLDEVIHLFEPPMPNENYGSIFQAVTEDDDNVDDYESTGEVSADATADHQEQKWNHDTTDDQEQYDVTEDHAQMEGHSHGETDIQEADNISFSHGDVNVQDDEATVVHSHESDRSDHGGELDGEPDSFHVALEPENLDPIAEGDFDVNEGLSAALSPRALEVQAESAQDNAPINNKEAAEVPNAIDIHADAPHDEAVSTADAATADAATADDGFVEIDWHEDLVEEGNLSNASKRPRAEDEPDVEETKDVKRQKS